MHERDTMTETPGSPDSKQPDEPELCGGTTGFIMMIVMFFTIFIMFNYELRVAQLRIACGYC
jgi:hypothetical protein